MLETKKLRTFDIENFIKANKENSELTLKFLREDKLWVHFENLNNFYGDLFQAQRNNTNALKRAQTHYLANCMINIAKGISNILAGHLTDSTIYARRTVESIRYATFLRDNQDSLKSWIDFSQRKKFEVDYKAWWAKVGRALVSSEFPQSDQHYKYASAFGSHSNTLLFNEQHIETENSFKICYQDIDETEKSYNTLLGTYMWQIWVHSCALSWWIKKSGLVNAFTNDQLRYFFEVHKSIEKDYARVERRIKTTHNIEDKIEL